MLIILNAQLTKSSNHYAQHYNAGKKKNSHQTTASPLNKTDTFIYLLSQGSFFREDTCS